MTPELIASIYTTLRHTRPFVNWALPEAEGLKFTVNSSAQHAALFVEYRDGRYEIKVSRKYHTYLSSIVVSVAHEMVHLYAVRKYKTHGHGPRFKQLAARVCKHHGWDPLEF